MFASQAGKPNARAALEALAAKRRLEKAEAELQALDRANRAGTRGQVAPAAIKAVRPHARWPDWS
jgi:hypothetical protein